MQRYLIFILSLFISSCYAKMDYPDLAYGIVNNYSKEIKNKYNLKGFGKGGCMIDAVQSVFISYTSNQKVDIETARILFINVDEGLIKKFNEDEQIRPFLANYPFTYNNIELDLSFFENDGSEYDDGHISFVTLIKGNICYAIHDPSIRNNNPLVIVHRENYEEALKIVRESRNQCSSQ